MFSIGDCKCAKELIALGFSERLLIPQEACKEYLQHCKSYNMKFLKGSYGTIVHRDFDKYFDFVDRTDENYEIKQKLICGRGLERNYTIEGVNLFLDHINLFKSKIEKEVYIVTSSPYYLQISDLLEEIKNYPYNTYAIHPNLLDYHAFMSHKNMHPLFDLSFAFTNATEEQIKNINDVLFNDLGLFVGFQEL